MERLKVLVVPAYRIFPIDSGGAHGQLTFLQAQQHAHEIDLVVTPDNISASDLKKFSVKFPFLNLLPVNYKKEKSVDKLLSFLKKQVRKFSGKDFAYQLAKQKGLNGILINSPAVIEQIQKLSVSKKYDLIQVEHVKNLGLISILKGAAKTIFIHHEVFHSRVHQDMISLSFSRSFSSYITGLAEGAEIHLLNQYDGVITFNKDDNELLINKGMQVLNSTAQPFALFKDELKKVFIPSAMPNLVLIGGETHFPNKEGLSWFLNEVFPLVKNRLPELQVKITSVWSEAFKESHKDNQIIFTGFIEDLTHILSNSVLIVPIRIGSGIRVKVFTSFAKGLPIVSTSLGASGIPGLSHLNNIMLADEPADFAACIIEVCTRVDLQKKLSDNAVRLASENFSGGSCLEERDAFYRKVLNNGPVPA